MCIILDRVEFSYPGSRAGDSLRVDALEIKKGDFVSVLGSNGSGKTSFAYILTGIIPHAVEGRFRGEVTLDGRNILDQSLGDLASKVGMVFQNPELVIFNVTVREEVAFGVKNLKLDSPEKRITESLETVGLLEFEKRNPNDLSEGQKQLLCIACVLAMGTDYIVLDEPVAHLDYRNSRQVYDILKKLNENGKTVIIVEHDTDNVWEYSNKTIVLGDNKVVRYGMTKDILQKPKFLENLGIKPTFKYKNL